MTTLRLDITLTYDADLMHGDDPEAMAWFRSLLQASRGDELYLFSQELGDIVGSVRVLHIGEYEDEHGKTDTA